MPNNNKDGDKKPQKAEKSSKSDIGSGIMGLGIAIVIVSITYSSYRIFYETNDSMLKLALIPQVVFAALAVTTAFWKSFTK